MERDFKGVWIPKEIWLNKELTALDKMIFTEIDSLDNEEGCTASNEYIAEFCQCGITKVSNSIAKLIQMGYIYQESFNGRTRVLKSRLTKNVRQIYTKNNSELQKEQSNKYNNLNKDNKIILNKDIKHIYGEYKHVRLTDAELDRLYKDYGETTTKEAIKHLDEYIEMKGVAYKNHNLALRKWVFDAISKKPSFKKQMTSRQYTQEEFDSMYDNLDDISV